MSRYNYNANFPNDEPATIDELGRLEVSHEIARIALLCNAPMVIGIYGPWGSGKSSFMAFVKCAIGDQKNLLKDLGQNFPKAKTVQFNPWEAQFVEEPAVALIEKIARDCGTYSVADTKDRIGRVKSGMRKGMGIAAAVASIASELGLMPGIASVLKKIFDIGKEETEELADQSSNKKDQPTDSLTIQQEFKVIIDKSLKKCKADRLIIFIDDLDRCTHEQTLKLLEALKLYLNHEKCVYLIGVDPNAIKASIEHQYRDSTVAIKGEDYLDKIVQIPFRLPGVSREARNTYISGLLGNELMQCSGLMMAGLGDSPRNLKRFSLLLKMNYLAGRTQAGYNPETATLFLIIQWISEMNRKRGGIDLFSKIATDRRLMLRLVERSADGLKTRKDILEDDRKFIKIFEMAMDSANVPRDLAEVDLYIHLARQVGGGEEDMDEAIRSVNLKDVIKKHEEWILSGDKSGRGKQANLLREQYAKSDLTAEEKKLLKGVNLSRAYLFGIFMEGSDLTGAILYEAVMEEAALSKIILNKADLRKVNLRGADLKEAKFKSANMREADLWLADLSKAKMNAADLTMANLVKADLTKAQLRCADLVGADLKGAKLSGADLTDADLTNANLLGADLKGAILSCCNLKGAYLAGVKNLTEAQFKSAGCREQCTPPEFI